MSNYHSSFHFIDLKLDIEPSLLYCRRTGAVRAGCSRAAQRALQLTSQSEPRRIVMNIHAEAGLIVGNYCSK